MTQCDIFVNCVIQFFNVLILFTGLGLLGLGICSALELKETIVINMFGIHYMPMYIMVVGSIVIIISIIGCYGAARGRTGLLAIYSTLVSILMICTAMLAVIVILKNDYIVNQITKNMKTSFDKVLVEGDSNIFPKIEEQFHCCGPSGKVSYEEKEWKLSDRCCPSPPCSGDGTYPECKKETKVFVTTTSSIVGAIVSALTVIQIIQLALSIYLSYSIHKSDEEYA